MKGKPHNYYLAALFFVLAFASGIGIGYIYAVSRSIMIYSQVTCRFPGLIS